MRALKRIVLIVGDVLVLYASLFIVLGVRYGSAWHEQFINQHALPFTIVFGLWILVSYVAGLYDLRRLRNNLDFVKTLSLTLFINAVLAVGFFYALPGLGITPKTNLLAFFIIFAALCTLWRRFFNRFAAQAEALSPLLLVGSTEAAREIASFLKEHPQIGFTVHTWLNESSLPSTPAIERGLRIFVTENNIDLIVVPRDFKKEPRFASAFFDLITSGIEIQDIPTFYESIFRKIPLSEVNEEWFLEHIPRHRRFYDDLKHAGEFLAALLLGIILLPLELVIALLVKLTSPGPVIYAQVRVGENGRKFVLYKFRTMRADAEAKGPQWAAAGDKRSTSIGRILRYSHLDELPQLVNILKGELSFVGPRPERPEFVAPLREQVPYYDIRLLVKPGVTGWAQINYHNDQTVEDVIQKLQYDVYYLKNRSPIIDIAIILKTIKALFVAPE